MRDRVRDLARGWADDGYELGFGVGVAQGFATLGSIGFEGRYEYTAIGSVVNLAARLCAVAAPWQILVSQRVLANVKGHVASTPVGDLELRGFSRAVAAFGVDELPRPTEVRV
jgi:adenylate cyclase